MKSLPLVLILITILFQSIAQKDWELKKDNDGIKIYTRGVSGSNIVEFKAEAVMEGTLSNFVAVMQDVDNYDKLFSNQKDSRIIEMSDTVHIHYSLTDSPWPVTDREGVYKYSYHQDHYDKTVIIKVTALKGLVEENPKLVRMYDASGYWQFVPVDYNKVMVTFQMYADPGGGIPSWVINMFIVESPYNDFQNLRERIKLKQYNNLKFDFLSE